MISIRCARPEDAHRIAEVHVETWRVAYRGQLPDEVIDRVTGDNRERLARELIADQDNDMLVAESDGRVVGFASTGAGRGEDCGELYSIYVHPTAWGTGAGSALLEAATAALAERGFEEAFLWVLALNERARGFYERHGWRFDGTKIETLGGVEVEEARYRLSGLAGI